MPYKNSITIIEKSIILLENKITMPHEYDTDTIFHMRRKLVTLTTELNNLKKLQWEHEHETVDFEDDR